MPRTYKYTGPLDEVEVPEFGLTVKRGERVEVPGWLRHPHFELVQPPKPKEKKRPAPKPVEVIEEPPVSPAEENVNA